MLKVIKATCIGDVVTAESLPVSIAEIFSEGQGQSSGLLFIDGDKAYYVAKTSPDLKTTLEQVIAAIGQISTSLSKVVDALPQLQAAIAVPAAAAEGLGATGTSAATAAAMATVAADTAAITAAVVQIEAAKTALTTLKGVLK